MEQANVHSHGDSDRIGNRLLAIMELAEKFPAFREHLVHNLKKRISGDRFPVDGPCELITSITVTPADRARLLALVGRIQDVSINSGLPIEGVTVSIPTGSKKRDRLIQAAIRHMSKHSEQRGVTWHK